MRQGYPIADLGPDTALFPGDTLLLLGTRDQAQKVRRYFDAVEEPTSTVEPVVVDEPAKIVDEALKEAKPERAPRKKQASAKEEKRWKTSVQLSRRHEKIVNEFVMHYRMQGLRPVSVNTIILAALDVLKQTPQLDEVVHAIVAADKRVTRLN